MQFMGGVQRKNTAIRNSGKLKSLSEQRLIRRPFSIFNWPTNFHSFFVQFLLSGPGAGFNGRANNLIFVLRHVQTTKKWLRLLLIYYRPRRIYARRSIYAAIESRPCCLVIPSSHPISIFGEARALPTVGTRWFLLQGRLVVEFLSHQGGNSIG